MTPEERIKELERKAAELMEWVEQKKIQQISFPLDEVSKTIIA